MKSTKETGEETAFGLFSEDYMGRKRRWQEQSVTV